jgi:hypothetical protein
MTASPKNWRDYVYQFIFTVHFLAMLRTSAAVLLSLFSPSRKP